MNTNSETVGAPRSRGWQQTTDVSVVHRAQQRAESPELARVALGEVCVSYWYPIYALIRRRRSADAAKDLTQAFCADLLARGIDTYDRRRARFRPWLRSAVENFVRRDSAYWRAEKRAAEKTIPFDALAAERRFQLEPRHGMTPERLFDRSFGYGLIAQALKTTRDRYTRRNELGRFEALKPFISMGEFEDAEYAPVAESLGLGLAAVRKAAHDLRASYRADLRAAVRRIVPREEFVEDELRYLYDCIRQPETS